ncbi:MAG: hypothetical protein JO313_06390 [Verrucomicrobia bacterium]|nr:hypothetical protein [Verrucomicrobiota bacterium]
MTNIADQEASEEVVGVRLNRWCTVSHVVVMLPQVSWLFKATRVGPPVKRPSLDGYAPSSNAEERLPTALF